ncbi:hypothetical protein HDU78_004365 [Chytriomyces hyalinus]|nr:hypothetical protein HDU78_004365 [Chytriomyces hyalinus]
MVHIQTRRASSLSHSPRTKLFNFLRIRNTRLVVLALLTTAFVVIVFFRKDAISRPTERMPVSNQLLQQANYKAQSEPVQAGLAKVPRIVYYNRHSACHANMLQVTQRLNLTFQTLNPGFLGGLGMDGDKANSCINDGFVRTVCETADVIIVADTMPDARPLFQSLVRESEHERCKANIVLELTTRFDWGVPDRFDYYKLNWKLAATAPKNLFWVTNNAFEPLDLSFEALATPKFRMLRPTGNTELPARRLSPSDASLAMCRQETHSPVYAIMKRMQIPFKHVSGGYGGPKTLANYRAFIEFPYQVSTMKLYENLAAGVVMLLPSKDFFRELIEKDLHAFGPWDKISRAGDDWHKYMDYYAPEIAPFVYYFNSFNHLKSMLTSDAILDTKNVRESAPKAYKKLVDRMLHGWADLFDEMGYKVTVDGQIHTPGSGVEVTQAPLYSSSVSKPATDAEWEKEFEKLMDWHETTRQTRIYRAREVRGAMTEDEIDAYTNSLEKKNPQRKKFATLDEKFAQIDFTLIKLLDYANGEFGKAETDVFGGSLVSVEGFDLKAAMTEVHDFLQSISQNAILGPSNYGGVSKLHRAFALMSSLFHSEETSRSTESETKLLDSLTEEQRKSMKTKLKALTRVVYPWAFSNSFTGITDLMGSFKQPKGIVLSFGESGFERGLLAIQHIRKNLNCHLPIEVFYNGIQDLDTAKSQALNNLKGVSARNLQDVFPGIAEDRNYHSKPYAVLAASFKHVIYLDDDVILFKSPEEIATASNIFKDYGTLFFKGRSFEFGNSRWTRWFIKSPSVAANTTGRYFTNLSKDEMDASLMLFDKTRLKVVLGLLTSCHLNLREVREGGLDKHLQGDKETYWLSLELLRVPYKFVPGIAGAAGSLQEKDGKVQPNSVCGPQSHLDEFGELLHVNSRSARFNNELDKWEKTLSHYIAPASGDPGRVDSTTQPWCISGQPDGSVTEVFSVGKREKDLVLKLREVEMEMQHESWMHFLQEHV